MTIDNRSQRVVVAAVYAIAMFMAVLDTTIVTVALPAIARDFHVSAVAAGTVPIAYLVALTVFIPVSGWLGDRIGGTRALLGAIALFTLGSALCAAATSLPLLIGFSALQGIGGAIMLPVGLAMLFRVYPPADRVRLSSTLALVTAMGPALGPILGGLFTTYATWRLVFLVNVPVGLAALAWGLLRLDSHRQPHPGRLDVAGLALSAAGLGTFMAGVSLGPVLSWADPIVLVMVVAGTALLTALVLLELHVRAPLIDLRLFRNRLFTAATGLYGLASAAYIGTLYLVALFLQEALGVSALVSGLTSVASAVGIILGGQLVTRVLYPRIGPRRLTAAGLVLIAASLASMTLVTAGTNLWWVRVVLFTLGLGVSAVFIPSQAISMATISTADTGKASPIFNAGKQFGSAVGVALLATIVGVSGGARSAASAGAAGRVDLLPFDLAFGAAAAIALGGVTIALAIADRDAASTMARTPRAASHRPIGRTARRSPVPAARPSGWPGPAEG